VTLHPGTSARALLGPEAERWFAHEIAGDVASRIAGELERATVAHVEASDIDEALDLVTLATDLVRVFQKKGAMFRTTMFGLPGQVYRSHIRYFAVGKEGGPAFRNRGEKLGSIFNDDRHAAWQASRAFAPLAAHVGADGPLPEGPRRALLGVQLLSQATLEHRPAFKIPQPRHSTRKHAAGAQPRSADASPDSARHLLHLQQGIQLPVRPRPGSLPVPGPGPGKQRGPAAT
jgi:hypothetical protein